ncbi:hypothetical protein YC2023_036537 [Brassica napus]
MAKDSHMRSTNVDALRRFGANPESLISNGSSLDERNREQSQTGNRELPERKTLSNLETTAPTASDHYAETRPVRRIQARTNPNHPTTILPTARERITKRRCRRSSKSLRDCRLQSYPPIAKREISNYHTSLNQEPHCLIEERWRRGALRTRRRPNRKHRKAVLKKNSKYKEPAETRVLPPSRATAVVEIR